MSEERIGKIINGQLLRLDERLNSHGKRMNNIEKLTANMLGSWNTCKWTLSVFLPVIIGLLMALILRTM